MIEIDTKYIHYSSEGWSKDNKNNSQELEELEALFKNYLERKKQFLYSQIYNKNYSLVQEFCKDYNDYIDYLSKSKSSSNNTFKMKNEKGEIEIWNTDNIIKKIEEKFMITIKQKKPRKDAFYTGQWLTNNKYSYSTSQLKSKVEKLKDEINGKKKYKEQQEKLEQMLSSGNFKFSQIQAILKELKLRRKDNKIVENLSLIKDAEGYYVFPVYNPGIGFEEVVTIMAQEWLNVKFQGENKGYIERVGDETIKYLSEKGNNIQNFNLQQKIDVDFNGMGLSLKNFSFSSKEGFIPKSINDSFQNTISLTSSRMMLFALCGLFNDKEDYLLNTVAYEPTKINQLQTLQDIVILDGLAGINQVKKENKKIKSNAASILLFRNKLSKKIKAISIYELFLKDKEQKYDDFNKQPYFQSIKDKSLYHKESLNKDDKKELIELFDKRKKQIIYRQKNSEQVFTLLSNLESYEFLSMIS